MHGTLNSKLNLLDRSAYWFVDSNCDIVLCSSYVVGFWLCCCLNEWWWWSRQAVDDWSSLSLETSFNLYSSWVDDALCMGYLIKIDEYWSENRRIEATDYGETTQINFLALNQTEFWLDRHNRCNYLLCMLHLFVCINFELWSWLYKCEFFIIRRDDDFACVL